MKPISQRKSRPIPEVLTNEEQSRLLAALAPSSKLKLRNLCMTRLMLNAGLRSAEVVAIRHRDIEWSSSQLKVRNGKGGRDRILWLSDEDLCLLRQCAEAQGKCSPSSLIFQTRLGKAIDTRFLRAMLEKKGRLAGLIKRVHPHLLRHTFATDLLRATRNIYLVQKALGHSSIQTTQVYLHLVDDELEVALKGLRNGEADRAL